MVNFFLILKNNEFYSQLQLKLPGTAGLYSIHLIAFDKAGNYKVTRRLVLYDSNSHVSHNPFLVTRVQTGSPKTNFTWIVHNTTLVNVVWSGRFRNALHDQNKWLNEVVPNLVIPESLDDHYGRRSIKKINNMHGNSYFIYSFTLHINDY